MMPVERVRRWGAVVGLAMLVTMGCDHGGLGSDPDLPATVQLLPSSSSYHEGDSVVVEFLITDARDVASVAFHLLYDREVLRFLPPATEGPFLGEDGTQTLLLATDYGNGGEVIVGFTRVGGGPGADGDGLLATFRFEAVRSGSSGFEFVAASVRDPMVQPLPSVFLVSQADVS